MSPRTPEQFEEMRTTSIEKILTAATTLFARKGVSQTKISHIAREANLSKGLVYNYFQTKENIEFAVIEQCFEVFKKIVENLPEEESPKKRLENLIKAYFASLREDYYYWHLYHQIIFQSEINHRFQSLLEKNMSGISSYLSSIFSEINPKDTLAELHLFNSLLDGIAFDFILMKEKYPLEKIEKKVLHLYNDCF